MLSPTLATPTDKEIKKILNGKRVCIIDDEPDPIEILEAYLSGYGLEIESFTSPSAAMEHIQSETPDILLLDVMMPEFDGWGFYTQLRSTDAMSALPVLFVTCLTDAEVEPEMQEGNLCATLSKPVDRQQLIAKMLDLLD
jgi:DNA-binding response OmpR family regulator